MYILGHILDILHGSDPIGDLVGLDNKIATFPNPKSYNQLENVSYNMHMIHIGTSSNKFYSFFAK